MTANTTALLPPNRLISGKRHTQGFYHLHADIVRLQARHTTANEPQTAAFQTAVDNVWFENIRNGSSIQASWNFLGAALRTSRWDYAYDLEDAIARALNVRTLDYELS